MRQKAKPVTPHERLYQLALAHYQMAAANFAASGSESDWLRFEAAKYDLDGALQLVRSDWAQARAQAAYV